MLKRINCITLEINILSDSILEILIINDTNESDDLSTSAVNYEIHDANRSIIDSGAMDYIDIAPDGYFRFRKIISYNVNFIKGKFYKVIIESDSGIGKRQRWVCSVLAEEYCN